MRDYAFPGPELGSLEVVDEPHHVEEHQPPESSVEQVDRENQAEEGESEEEKHVVDDGEILEHTLLRTAITGRRGSSHCHWE